MTKIYDDVKTKIYQNKKTGQFSLTLSKKDIKKNKELLRRLGNCKTERVTIKFWDTQK